MIAENEALKSVVTWELNLGFTSQTFSTASRFADRYVDKLFVSKEDVPIARVGHAFAAFAFVGERMKP